jgi:DNA-binding IclR family transcriptional regulator
MRMASGRIRVAGQKADLDRAEGGYIQSVVRAADIIRLLTREGVTSISVAEASKALGLQRTTTHRYMATLASVSLLQREPGSSRFILGPLAHEVFSAIMRESASWRSPRRSCRSSPTRRRAP